MLSSRLTTSIFVLSFAFFLQTAIGAADYPLFHFCLNSGNFTATSPYQKNLGNLLGSLNLRTPPTGFNYGSVGQAEERAHGLALCRGDASTADCKSCVAEAGGEILKRCPYKKGAVIWYDNCLLKYSDINFFGKIAYENRFYMWNLNNVSDPQSFNRRTRELLSQLAEKAQVAPRMYATREEEMGESKKLYGLVQCTRDLSGADCKKCLDSAIDELPKCCDGKEGGRVVGASCNFRYEIYPFVNA